MGDARETEKDPDAFRTISEVAEDLNLPQHVLRFWETRFPQIKPVKRAGGRRFYRPEDVDLLRGIRQLLYREGYTIKGVQKILKEQGIRHVQDIGVERDVAVMRTAPPDRAPPQGGQEGVTFGGLLGLLPRRRGKGGEGPSESDLPRDVELPLPFPDPEADRDLADQGEPLAPLPPRVQARERRLEERRFDDAGYEERIYQERSFAPEPAERREPRLGPARPTLDEPVVGRPSRPAVRLPEADQDEFFDEERAAPPVRRPLASPPERGARVAAPAEPRSREEGRTASGAPSFAPPRPERAEPLAQRRPTRGPAARVSTALLPEGEDPLLPFLTDEPAPARPEDPLEERIRRLKAQEAGPPEEYLPPKFRRRTTDSAPAAAESLRPNTSAPEPRPVPPVRVEPQVSAKAEPSRGLGVAPQAPSGAWPELARAAAAAERDLAAWHEQIRPHEPAAPEPADWDEDEQDEAAPLSSSGPQDSEEAWDDDWFEDEAVEPPADTRREPQEAFQPQAQLGPAYDEEEPYGEASAGAEEPWPDAIADDDDDSGHDDDERGEPWPGDASGSGGWANDGWASNGREGIAGHEAAPVEPHQVSAPLSARLGMQLAGSGPIRPVRIPRSFDYEAGMFKAPQQPAAQAAPRRDPRAAGSGAPPHGMGSAPVGRLSYPTSVSPPAPHYGVSYASSYGQASPHEPWDTQSAPQPRFGLFPTPLDEAAAVARAHRPYDAAPSSVHGAPAAAVYGQRLPGASAGAVPMASVGAVAGENPSQWGNPQPAYGADSPAHHPADPWGRPLPPPAQPAASSQGVGRHSGEAATSAPATPPFWQGRDPFDTPAPVPIEPYLPPHLRAQPPLTPPAAAYPPHGAAPAPAEAPLRIDPRSSASSNVHAVLSREDVNRLQAALYELGECRRLLRDMGDTKPD